LGNDYFVSRLFGTNNDKDTSRSFLRECVARSFLSVILQLVMMDIGDRLCVRIEKSSSLLLKLRKLCVMKNGLQFLLVLSSSLSIPLTEHEIAVAGNEPGCMIIRMKKTTKSAQTVHTYTQKTSNEWAFVTNDPFDPSRF